MGVYIPDMKMPKNGEWVNVNICSDGSVYFVKSASNGFVFYGVRKGEAIEIPPHGRLIDKDALDINQREEQAFAEYEKEPDDEFLEGIWNGLHQAAKCLSCASTIITADKEEQR